jgi:hypothetical protein
MLKHLNDESEPIKPVDLHSGKRDRAKYGPPLSETDPAKFKRLAAMMFEQPGLNRVSASNERSKRCARFWV